MSDVPLHQHWHDVYVKRWLIVLTAVAAGLAALWFSMIAPPIYEAKATFYLASNATPQNYLGATPDAPPEPLFPAPEEKAAALNVGILRGREVRSRLADRFGLPIGEIEKRVDVTVSGEFLIDVFVRNSDPVLAADIANAVPEIYSGFHERSMRARAENSAVTLGDRLEDLENQRRVLHTKLRETQSGSLSTADAAALDNLQNERETARTESSDLQAQIAQAQARIVSLEETLAREDGYYAAAETVENTAALSGMLDRVLELRVELASVSDGPASPRRRSIEDQIAEIETAMAQERRRLTTATVKPGGSLHEELRLQLAMARATIAGLTEARVAALARIAAATDRFNEVLQAVSVSSETAVALSRLDDQIALTGNNLAAALLQMENATPPLVIVERAVPPLRPAFPLVIVNVFVSVLCGLVFGTYYALFVAHSERARQARASAASWLPMFTQQELNQLGVKSRAAEAVRGGYRDDA